MRVMSCLAALWIAAPQDHEDYGPLLKALPKSKHTLADGIRQATQNKEIPLSAKFEVEDGKFSLSVYTAEKGLSPGAEHNVLKELGGNPEGDAWKPDVEVFKDVEHVSRSAEQLTLMALSRFSLLDIIAKAEKQQKGTVFSVIPMRNDRKGVFVVKIAADGKVTELDYDVVSGELVK